jgi:hypothetical protein
MEQILSRRCTAIWLHLISSYHGAAVWSPIKLEPFRAIQDPASALQPSARLIHIYLANSQSQKGCGPDRSVTVSPTNEKEMFRGCLHAGLVMCGCSVSRPQAEACETRRCPSYDCRTALYRHIGLALSRLGRVRTCCGYSHVGGSSQHGGGGTIYGNGRRRLRCLT